MTDTKKKVDPATVVGPAASQKMPTTFMLHGPPGSGKTTTAATISKKWPGIRPAGPKAPVFLDDTLFFAGDADGLSSLHAIGIDAPQINLVELWEEYGFLRTLALLPQLVTYAKEKWPTITRGVFDTLSAADEEAQNDSKHIDDKRQFYGAVLDCHRRNSIFIRGAGFDYWVLNCHSKAFSEGETADSKRQATALRMAGGGAIVPAIVGQGLSRYQRAVSLQTAMVLKEPGAGKPSIYKLQTVTDPLGFQAKNRYAQLLKKEEDPDFGAIVARIEEAKSSLLRTE